MKKNIVLIVILSLLITILLIPAAIGASESIYSYPPYPQGEIGISKPEIGWTVFLGNNKVENASLLLNGEPIEIKYDKERETFFGFPKKVLSNRNEVNFKLKLEEWNNVIEKNWTFTIDNAAISSLPLPNDNQLKAINYANDYRYILNLPLYEFNNSLNLTAQKHADYQANLNIFSHYQLIGTEGFFGESVLDRANYYGFAGGLYEDISYQRDDSIQLAVDSLFDAPYHRIPFLVPNNQYFGYGMNKYYHVLNFGNNKILETNLVAYPGPNQDNVPVAWLDYETPDPLRFYPEASKNVGYPIVVGIYGNDVSNLKVNNVYLSDNENNIIPFYINSPKVAGGNDEHLSQEIIIIPKNSLDFSKKYKVRVQLDVIKDGVIQNIDNSWYFTTESKKYNSIDSIHNHYIYPPHSNNSDTILFKVGQRYIWVDNISYPLDAVPFIENNRTMVPIRALGNSLGANVNWDSATKTVIYEKGSLSILLPIDKNYADINKKTILLDQGAIIKNGRSYVPLRFVSEQLDADVEWLPLNREVIITNNINK